MKHLPRFPTAVISQRAGATLLLAALLVVLLSALGSVVGDDKLGRHGLALHAGAAAVILPLMAAVWVISRMSHAAARWSVAFALLTVCLALSLALPLVGASQVQLVSFFPLFAGPLHATVLIVAAGIFSVVLLMPGPTNGMPGGLRWLALPVTSTLVVLTWSWTATADVPPHIREEISAWAVGHGWRFALVSIMLWSWLQTADIDGPPRHRWMIAGTLPALVVPAAILVTGFEDPRYFATVAWVQLIAMGCAPTLLAVTIFRDPIRRSAAGAALWSSVALLLASWATALVLTAMTPNDARLGALILQHGIGIGLLISLWGAARQHGLPPVRPSALAKLATLGIATGLALTPPDQNPLPKVDDDTRRHAVAQRDKEIAERFAQGVAMMQRREYAYAITAFHRVLALDPTLPDAHVNIGFALYETGDLASAQRFFESATRLNRNQLNAYYGLAITASARGQHEVASGAIRTWLHLAPADDPFRPRAEALFDRAIAARRADSAG